MKRHFEPSDASDASAEHAPCSLDGVHRLADRFPPRLYAEHLKVIFSIGKSQFYALAKAGKFDRFEIRPRIGRTAWSRELVQAYLDGNREQSSRFVRSA